MQGKNTNELNGRVGHLLSELNEVDAIIKSQIPLIDDFDKERKIGKYNHQVIFLDTRDVSAQDKLEVSKKVQSLGKNLKNKGLIFMLNADPAESRLALGKILKRWGKDPANYSPSDGPFLIGHTQDNSSNNKKPITVPAFVDFSGMNNKCIAAYINNIEWALIHNLDLKKVEAKWRRESIICESDQMVEAGRIPSIEKIYRYITSWFVS